MITPNGKKKGKKIHIQYYKNICMEGQKGCKKKNKMFTGVVWSLEERDHFFSAFFCGFSFTT